MLPLSSCLSCTIDFRRISSLKIAVSISLAFAPEAETELSLAEMLLHCPTTALESYAAVPLFGQ